MLTPVVASIMFFWLAIHIGLSAAVSISNSAEPIVDLGYARYRGLQNATLKQTAFYGIHFAEAPTGSLRWKPPVPVSTVGTNSTTVINATTPGPSCVQGFPFWANPQAGTPPGSEDCLILNVLTPADATPGSNLPVLVAIHGGGYTLGDALSSDAYTMLNHTNNSFIGVSVQYRLGAYGFLGSKLYASQGGAPNLGLLDQRLALEWVHKHISAFGGDSSKITLIGGSAGGGSVTSQMTLYGGDIEQPFRAAIIEFPWWQQYLRDEQLERQYQHLLSAANCADLACLEELGEEALKNATQQSYATAFADGAYPFGSFYYGPYVDGDVIRGLPMKEVSNGRITNVPMLVDRDMYEGYAFTNPTLSTLEDEEQDFRTTFQYATPEFTQRFNELYPREAFNSTFWRRQTWYGDLTINCPTWVLASKVTKSYKLIFNAGTQTHAATGPFLSDFTGLPMTNFNATVADYMKDWYMSFAIFQDPNEKNWSGVEKPVWDLYGKGGNVMMVNQTSVGTERDADWDFSERCRFWLENADIAQK